VEEKNKEITDSINYAKRIQSAILPPDRLVAAQLGDSFVLYKPKDIVAVEFYWMYTSSSNDDDATEDASQNEQSPVLFAAADCIGHGVPGALVSVVC
jgi:serine phosphatase RsbU (regulator of sigma subunit)